MFCALIPPRGLEHYMHKSSFQMVIAPVYASTLNVNYMSVARACGRSGNHIIVDNGEYEGNQVSHKELLLAAYALGANEIVLPDVMRNALATTQIIELFLDQYPELDMKCMAVAQGKNRSEFRNCIDTFAKKLQIYAVGLPRHMLGTVSSSARIDIANWIHDNYPKRFEIHFLGTNPMWLGELRATTRYAPHVRSVDSSIPFYYAMANTDLLEASRQSSIRCQKITRPSDYFIRDYSKISAPLVERNIETLFRWTNGT